MRKAARNLKMKKFTHKMQAKLLLVFCVVLIAMIGLIARLVFLNRTDGERYAKKVLSQQTYTSTVIPFQRGSILDRKGTVLATSDKVYNIILDVKYMLEDEKYPTPTIKALTSTYDSITEETVKELVDTKPESRYVILKKGISYEDMMPFKEKEEKDSNIKGVWFEEDYVRKYPYKTLASSVIGFTSSGNVGNWGIEQYYNDQLNGINGIEYGYIDSELKVEETVKPAINGNTVISTIDANVQGIVQQHIKTFNEEFGSVNIGVLVMNPNNGEILAMASNVEYDLNNPADLTPFYTKKEIEKMSEKERLDALNAIWRNFTISDTYEPGSTFKPFTVAAGLEENLIHSEDTYVCDGFQEIGGFKIKCSKRTGHGTITLTQALMLSCNDALMQIGAKEGKKVFYDYQNFFGFGHKTGIDLPGEAGGILVSDSERNATAVATNSFGQNFNTTMIQMATGFSSLVNGGYYYEPHIAKQILNPGGATLQNFDKVLVKESVSRETSEFIRNAMFQTVEEGTAKGAQVPGYKVGGKTGTAEKIPRSADTYLVSFIGCVPADNPEAVIYVVIDEPQNVVKQADSSIATRFASGILSEILPFLEIYPTESTDTQGLTENTPVLPSTGTQDGSEQNTAEGTDEQNQNNPDGTGDNTEAKGTGDDNNGSDTGEDNNTSGEGNENGSGDTGNSQNNTSSGENSIENSGAGDDDDFNPNFLPETTEGETQDDNSN